MNGKLGPEDIDVVILCGGMGTRLRTVITDRPKALAKINGIPFINFLTNYVASFGFKRFILCIGYKGNQIKQYYKRKNFPYLEIVFSEEKSLLGTGGAIKNAEGFIKSNPFLVMNGDTFCRLDLDRFIDFHFTKQALFSMASVRSRKGRDYGTVRLNDSGQIIGFDEKKEVGKCYSFINAGIYLMDHILLSNIPLGKNFSLEYELFPSIIRKRSYGFVSEAEFIDIGTPSHYRKAEKFLVAEK